jgi:hypothetical protein
LHCGNRRSSRSIVISHTGRQSAMRVHPLSALMFSNTALEPTATSHWVLTETFEYMRLIPTIS